MYKATFSGTTATTAIVVVMAVHDFPLEGQSLLRLSAGSAQVFESLCKCEWQRELNWTGVLSVTPGMDLPDKR